MGSQEKGWIKTTIEAAKPKTAQSSLAFIVSPKAGGFSPDKRFVDVCV